MRREWYVYVLPHEDILGLVLSGYETHEEALTEAQRVMREIPKWKDYIAVFHRGDERIREYARTHPAWAKREGFPSPLYVRPPREEYLETIKLISELADKHPEKRTELLKLMAEATEENLEYVAKRLEELGFGGETSATFGQARVPSNVCPVCGDTVVGWEMEYAGHIKTRHPEEWRRLESDPSYTLKRTAEAGITRCRYCGAPYAYRENLELHERGCPRRT